MTDVLAITQDSFDAEVRDSERPVLVDYRADWCLPCRLVEPVLGELAQELAERVRFVAVDADDCPELVRLYGVVSLPTFQLWRDGELLTVLFGARPKAVLRDEITAALNRV